MNIGGLKFAPIDIDSHKDICIRFREDSFVTSFGNADRFHEADGKGSERYIDWLTATTLRQPEFAVHVWKGDEIVGQMELGLFRDDQSIGYVNLYYLAPEYRGKGFARHLDAYTIHCFETLGLRKARLSVSPTNIRAIRFYEKMGWKDLGPRPGHPEVHFMERVF